MDSTVDSFEDRDDDGHRQSRLSSVSTASYPVFVRPASDDLAEFVDHPSMSTLDTASSDSVENLDPYEKQGGASSSSLAFSTFLASDEPYTPPHWTPPTRSGPNHYFREKKWDFFPELATPSALPQGSFHQSNSSKSRKKDSVRSLISDKGAVLVDVRNSIRSYVQRRLSRNSLDKKEPKRASPQPQPSSVPMEYPVVNPRGYTPPPLQSPHTAPSMSSVEPTRHSTIPKAETHSPIFYAAESDKLARLSISPTAASSTTSSAELRPPTRRKPIAFHRKNKQLAVPMSPYQKYGAAIWDKSGKEKRISYRQSQRVRFPKYRKQTKPGVVSFVTPLTSPSRTQLQEGTRHAVRALQDGTSHVLVAIDGARKKMAGTKLDRKHSQLKARIRLVGPVNPYTAHAADPWV
ncbi:hypothetical protein BJX99DRAFT_226032 [Aspergillus californicus]